MNKSSELENKNMIFMRIYSIDLLLLNIMIYLIRIPHLSHNIKREGEVA